MRRPLLAISVVFLSLLSALTAHSDITVMRRTKAPPTFKIYVGNLTPQEREVLKYALKQWVMYDKLKQQKKLATTGLNSKNRNETNRNVTAPGGDHTIQNAATTNPAKKHTMSSRSMSSSEHRKMVAVYGASSPFHATGQPVQDPVTNPSAWFDTTNEAGADMTVKTVTKIPKNPGALGKMDYRLKKVTVAGTAFWQKTGIASGPAVLFMRKDPGKNKQNGQQRTWCYPTDTDGDGWITNMDKKCPENALDYYQMIKHELGHWFCFWHKGADFTETTDPVPQYNLPFWMQGLQSPHNETGCCQDRDSEFAEERPVRLYFASDRPGGFGGSDIWFATWDDTLDTYADITNCGPVVNSPSEETHPESGAGDAWLYFSSDRPGGFGGSDIYRAFRADSASWDSVTILGPGVNGPFSEIAPAEWNDRFYFASDRPGGSGGMDLWVAMQVDSPTVDYLPAFNLGGTVNSPAEDLDVFVGSQNADSSAVIYFASNRPGGAGGMDIYRAEMTLATWSPPLNLGPPVNEPSNDFAPYIPPFHDRIFFASDRDAFAGAAVQMFEALNTIPRPQVLWGADDEGVAGDTVTVELAVYNEGNFPFLATPAAFNTNGWPISFDASPFVLAPGELHPFPIDVIIPGLAIAGDTSVVVLDVDGDGQFATNWGRAVVVVPAPIPTTTEWGLAVLIALAVLTATFLMRRRRAAV